MPLLPCSHIWLIDPISKKNIFDLFIFDARDKTRFLDRESWLRSHGYPDLVRVICTSFQEVRVMKPDEEIPVPLAPRPIRPGYSADYVRR